MKKGRKPRLRPFRLLALGLGILTVFLLIRFPSRTVALEEKQKLRDEAAELYYEAQSRNNQLHDELEVIGTQDFIERTARRDHGYCWYGEVIFEVDNLDELLSAQEFAVYGQE